MKQFTKYPKDKITSSQVCSCIPFDSESFKVPSKELDDWMVENILDPGLMVMERMYPGHVFFTEDGFKIEEGSGKYSEFENVFALDMIYDHIEDFCEDHPRCNIRDLHEWIALMIWQMHENKRTY